MEKICKESGAEFILLSRYPNEKKFSSMVEIYGTNAKTFKASEVGLGFENVWHQDTDNMQGMFSNIYLFIK